MPIVDEKYQNPGWQDGAAPAINADELNAMSGALERIDGDHVTESEMTTAIQQAIQNTWEASY